MHQPEINKRRREEKRRHPDLNWGVKVLQTSALPLGYAALKKGAARKGKPGTWSERRDLNPRQPPWQGGALPLSYSRMKGFKK